MLGADSVHRYTTNGATLSGSSGWPGPVHLENSGDGPIPARWSLLIPELPGTLYSSNVPEKDRVLTIGVTVLQVTPYLPIALETDLDKPNIDSDAAA